MSRLPEARPPSPPEDDSAWKLRSARLFAELRGPATAMVRRAFGRTFDHHAIEDIYASAWVATLRALERRHPGLADDEVRRYVLTAVARQASKELRRRRRRPVAPLENADAISDDRSGPDEQADRSEQSRITRDLLASLPQRRRAVLMLRYGWGLDPAQVCELVDGLSRRAYRKEITRGLDQLAERIRALESGKWCADREPILKAFAAGLADADQRRQAERHLAHCRSCSEFVSRLMGGAHDLGGAISASGAVELAAEGRICFPGRLQEVAERAGDSLGGALAQGGAPEALTGIAPATQRGMGAAAAGLTAKLAGLGAAGKSIVACFGGAAVAALCVATGVVGPLGPAGGVGEAEGRIGGDAPRFGGRALRPSAPSNAAPIGSRFARAHAADASPTVPGPSPSSAGTTRRTWVEARPADAPPGPKLVARHSRRNYSTRWSGGPPGGDPGDGAFSGPVGSDPGPGAPADAEAPAEETPSANSTPAAAP